MIARYHNEQVPSIPHRRSCTLAAACATCHTRTNEHTGQLSSHHHHSTDLDEKRVDLAARTATADRARTRVSSVAVRFGVCDTEADAEADSKIDDSGDRLTNTSPSRCFYSRSRSDCISAYALGKHSAHTRVSSPSYGSGVDGSSEGAGVLGLPVGLRGSNVALARVRLLEHLDERHHGHLVAELL